MSIRQLFFVKTAKINKFIAGSCYDYTGISLLYDWERVTSVWWLTLNLALHELSSFYQCMIWQLERSIREYNQAIESYLNQIDIIFADILEHWHTK